MAIDISAMPAAGPSYGHGAKDERLLEGLVGQELVRI